MIRLTSLMTPDAPRRSYRPSNQNVLEIKDDHIQDVSSVYPRIMDMKRSDIEVRLFKEGILQLTFVEGIIVEAHNVLQYEWRNQRVKHI